MPYIGSSRYKYSPYLTIHFGKTEKFIAGDAVPPFVGSSTFSQLPLYLQSMALHLPFEDAVNSSTGTVIDYSPAMHPIERWGDQEFTTPVCTPVGADSCARSSGRAIRASTFGPASEWPNGIVAHGDWSRLFEGDCTIEGWFLSPSGSISGVNGAGSFFQCVAFNIGDEHSSGWSSQKRLFTIIATSPPGGGLASQTQFNISERSGTEHTLLAIEGNVFDSKSYVLYDNPSLRYKKLSNSGTWRYWCLEKYNNVFRLLFHDISLVQYTLSANHNFGAITYAPSATYSVQVHLSGWNREHMFKAYAIGQPNLQYEGHYDEIRITPYARYKGNLAIPTGAEAVRFNYNDW